MTGSELLTALAQRCGNSTSLDSATSARFLSLLNQIYREVLTRPGMERLRRSTTTFDSVADTATYSITSAARVNRIWETTNQRRLWELAIDQYRTVEPDTTANTGTPEAFVWLGTTAPSTQQIALWPTPSAAITYTAEILAVLTDLANDSATPLLPLDFHDVLVDGAEWLEMLRRADERAPAFQERYERRVKQLQYWLAETDTGGVPFPTVIERSMFNGSYFPATRR